MIGPDVLIQPPPNATRKLQAQTVLSVYVLESKLEKPSEFLARIERDLVHKLVDAALKEGVWPEAPTLSLHVDNPSRFPSSDRMVLRAEAVAT